MRSPSVSPLSHTTPAHHPGQLPVTTALFNAAAMSVWNRSSLQEDGAVVLSLHDNAGPS